MTAGPPFDVSRETQERIEIFTTLLLKWNSSINLVSKGSLRHLATRHIQDSLQVFRCHHSSENWVDLGSGGGLPIVPCAIAAKQYDVKSKFYAIESDGRKCEFLRTVSRETGIGLSVINRRIEDVPPIGGDVVTARALAPLDKLLGLAFPHAKSNGVYYLLKGKSWQAEVNEARDNWSFQLTAIPSLTDSQSAILKIEQLQHA